MPESTEKINWLAEQVITLSEAAKLLPPRRRGKRPHTSTLFRWATKGFRGVILESVQVGGCRCTSVEALQRFFERLERPATCKGDSVQTTAQRRTTAGAVERRLDDMGF